MVAMVMVILIAAGAVPTMVVAMSMAVGCGGIAWATALVMLSVSGEAGIPHAIAEVKWS